MAYDSGLAQRIRELASGWPNVTEKAMFGGLAFMVPNGMFVGVIKDELMARIGPSAYASALAKPNVREMDFAGRPMKGYVFVDAAGTRDDRELSYWMEASLAFVGTLSPRLKKAKQPRAR